jgi:L-methionine (R)-S-oxide reductase
MAMTERQILLEKARTLAAETKDARELMAAVVRLLRQERIYFNWVGFYLLEGEELVLGPHEGKPTPHTRIPLNQGICGAAASSGQTVIVDDVNSDPRYLACSLETRSEIVVPIAYRGRILGEIDIDSDALAAFGRADQETLEALAEILAPRLAGALPS